jgi:hypothetical protein
MQKIVLEAGEMKTTKGTKTVTMQEILKTSHT